MTLKVRSKQHIISLSIAFRSCSTFCQSKPAPSDVHEVSSAI